MNHSGGGKNPFFDYIGVAGKLVQGLDRQHIQCRSGMVYMYMMKRNEK